MKIEISQQGIGGQKAEFSRHGKGAEYVFLNGYNRCGDKVLEVCMCANEFGAMAKAFEEMK